MWFEAAVAGEHDKIKVGVSNRCATGSPAEVKELVFLRFVKKEVSRSRLGSDLGRI